MVGITILWSYSIGRYFLGLYFFKSFNEKDIKAGSSPMDSVTQIFLATGS